MSAGMWFSEVAAVTGSGCRTPLWTVETSSALPLAHHSTPLPWRVDMWLPADHVPCLKGPWHPRKNSCWQYSPPTGTGRQAHTYTCTVPLSSLSASLRESWSLLSAVRGSKKVSSSEILHHVSLYNRWYWLELVPLRDRGVTSPGPAAIIQINIGYRFCG